MVLEGLSGSLSSSESWRRLGHGPANKACLQPPRLVVKTVLGYDFGVGEFTTHVRTYFSGDWDVRWGYGILTHGQVSSLCVHCLNLCALRGVPWSGILSLLEHPAIHKLDGANLRITPSSTNMAPDRI